MSTTPAKIINRLLLLLALFTCASAYAQPEPPLTLVTSFSILADMAEEVGGDTVKVISLVGPNQDAHVYQPRPRDLQTLMQADLLLINGLNFEPWIDRIIESTGYAGPVVVASDGADLILMHEGEGEVDPHAWQNVNNARVYVDNLLEALVAADPDSKATYRENAKAYHAQLDRLEQDIRLMVSSLARPKIKVVTSHDAFGYFGEAYGFEFLAPLGMNTESEPSAREVALLIEQIRLHNIEAVFVENITDTRLLQQIARETGSRIGGTLYSDALSTSEEGADTYISMMRHNLNTIINALR